MMRRLFFPLVTLFWVIMNVLLWRSEMSGTHDGGSPVPTAMIWDRILTAPDESAMVILHQGENMGNCRWLATVGEELLPQDVGTEFAPEGRVGRITGYRIDFDGNLRLEENSQRRLRFRWELELAPDKQWRRMHVQLINRPNRWEAEADADTERLTLSAGEEPDLWERVLPFADLKSPGTLLKKLGLPGGMGRWTALLAGLPFPDQARMDFTVDWQASQDWLRIAHARTRVFRLRARLFEGYEIQVLLSRVGEILKVELPGDIQLLNEGFAGPH
ncbi:MAG: hypothetical protein H7A46_25840 [Verrucomicrobiales bacterium]|nr:hypothetical protein [Verrucomicrobiales bacterium]